MNLYNVLSNRYVGMSNFERLFAQKFGGTGGKIEELEGVPPLTFTANGQPLLDYRIYGNTVQTGTPTPENPIVPSGCGERTENLFNGNGKAQNIGAASIKQFIESDMQVSPGETYCINASSALYSRLGFYMNNVRVSSSKWVSTQSSITIPDNCNNMYVEVRNYNFDVVTDEQLATATKIMLTKGSTAPASYIPYGYKLPLTVNGTEYPIYLGEVQTTRRIKKLVLTGEEDWRNAIGSGTQSRIYISLKSASIGMCTHYISGDALNPGEFDLAGGINLRFNISGVATTRTEWIDYLAAQYAAGTPVTIWYVLAEPETGIVNEPLHKIDDYIDTVSMEQAGVSIPTNKGSTTLDVDTTIKPSNVYIKYKS